MGRMASEPKSLGGGGPGGSYQDMLDAAASIQAVNRDMTRRRMSSVFDSRTMMADDDSRSRMSFSCEPSQKNQQSEAYADKYKIVVMVFIGERKEGDIRTASRALTLSTDRWCEVSFENKSLYGVALVHMIYQE